jgi:hypothetical protein
MIVSREWCRSGGAVVMPGPCRDMIQWQRAGHVESIIFFKALIWVTF